MSEFNSHDPESVAKALDTSLKAGKARIEVDLEEVRSKFSENFRKSLAYYVGSQVPFISDQDEPAVVWREKVFRIVDLVLLGIEHSDSHKLVTK